MAKILTPALIEKEKKIGEKPYVPNEVHQLLRDPMKILYIKGNGNYVNFYLWTLEIKSPLVSLSNVIAWLPKDFFLQTERSHIINMFYFVGYYYGMYSGKVYVARRLELNEDILKKPYNIKNIKLVGEEIPISASYKDAFFEKKCYMYGLLHNRYKKEGTRIKTFGVAHSLLYFCTFINDMDYLWYNLVLI